MVKQYHLQNSIIVTLKFFTKFDKFDNQSLQSIHSFTDKYARKYMTYRKETRITLMMSLMKMFLVL